MEAADKDLEEQLRDVGHRLSSPPLESVNDLFALLDQTDNLLSKVEQSPSNSMANSLRPAMKALIDQEFLRHTDSDVKVVAVACLNEITRITAPDAPYEDEIMKEIFQRTVETFENLDDMSSRSSVKRFTILETVAKVRSCVVMLDLECDDLILTMFQYFFRTIRPNHASNVFSSMVTIMTLVLEESEDISQDLISCLLESVKLNDVMPPVAQRLGESVIKNCAEKLKPYLEKLSSHSVGEYSQVVAAVLQGTTAAVVPNENHVSGGVVAEDSKISERTISDELPQGSGKTEQEVGYPEEHGEAAEKSSKPSPNNSPVCIDNGEPDVEESSAKEKPEVLCPSDQPKMSSEADRELDSVDVNSDTVQDESQKVTDKKASSVLVEDTIDHTPEVHKKETETSDNDEQNSSEACTGGSKFPSPLHVGDPASTKPKRGRSTKSAKRRGRGAIGVDVIQDESKKTSEKNASSVLMEDAVDHTPDVHLEEDAETSDIGEQFSSEAGVGVSKIPSPLHVGDPESTRPKRGRSIKSAKRRGKGAVGIDVVQDESKKTSEKNVSSILMEDAVDHTLDAHLEEDSETSDNDQYSSEADVEVSKVPTPVDVEDPDAIKPKRGRSAKSAKSRGRRAGDGDLASPSGRKEPTDASRVKSEISTSENSNSKKEGDSFSDSERRPSKYTGKKSQPVNTDQTPENAEVKSRRQAVKRGSSASKVSQGESSLKQQKLKVKQHDKQKPKKDGSGQKEMISSPKPVTKSKVQDNLEENLSTLSRRKRALGADPVTQTPTRSKLDDSIVGAKIKVWWPDDKEYYEGVVDSYEPSSKKHKILYTDGDVEVLYLKKERWQFVSNNQDSEEIAEDIATPDASLDESRGKRAKTSTSSVPKDTTVDASRKSGTGSGSVAKSKGKLSKASTPKIDDLHDDDSPKATLKSKDKAVSRSGQGSAKSGTKLSKHNITNTEKSNSKTINTLLDDAARSSKNSGDDANDTASKSKNKNNSLSSGSKGKKENMHKGKLSEETPKAGQKSKSGGDRKANGSSSAKEKPVVQETESSTRALSEKDEVAEKEASSRRKRKRK